MSVTNTSTAGAGGAAGTAELAVVSHFINGQIVEGTSGQVARRVSFASKSDVDRAVAAAAAAFPQWAAFPPLRRARILTRFRELMERDIVRLARIITSEHGKVASDAKGEMTIEDDNDDYWEAVYSMNLGRYKVYEKNPNDPPSWPLIPVTNAPQARSATVTCHGQPVTVAWFVRSYVA